jgi:hypothetical protein
VYLSVFLAITITCVGEPEVTSIGVAVDHSPPKFQRNPRTIISFSQFLYSFVLSDYFILLSSSVVLGGCPQNNYLRVSEIRSFTEGCLKTTVVNEEEK